MAWSFNKFVLEDYRVDCFDSGPSKGSIVDLFQPESDWAETARFQPPTSMG